MGDFLYICIMKLPLNIYVLYTHIRKSDGRIFYIGIGDKNRPYQKHGRNRYWHFIVNKDEYEVKILVENITWERACELEKNMITFYGRRDKGLGPLVNMTDGGDGACGVIPSKETIQKRVEKTQKPILVYNFIGELLYTFESTKKASEHLGILPHNITDVLKGNSLYASSFMFFYKDEYDEKLLQEMILENLSKSKKVGLFKMFTKDGIFVKEFTKFSDAAKFVGLKRTNKLKKCLNKSLDCGKRVLTAGGYFWVYSDKCTDDEIKSRVQEIKSYKKGSNLLLLDYRKKVKMISLTGETIKFFNSLLEAKEYLSLSSTGGISHCLSGKQKTSHGYEWSYV